MAMNDNDQTAYYLSRAEQEDGAALKAVNPLAADIHRSLASRYRAKARGFNAYDLEDCQKLA